MSWTPERVDLLRTMAAKGYSASQIAYELRGGISRSAVLGKAARIGVQLGEGNNSKFRPGMPDAPRAPRPDRPRSPEANAKHNAYEKVRRRTARAGFVGKSHNGAKTEGAVTASAVDIKVNTAPGPGVPFMETKHRQCRWPLWGDDTPLEEKLCCGAETLEGSSYCPFHRRASVTRGPPPERAINQAEKEAA